MNNPATGFLLLVIAGLMNASFTLPMKFTRRWAWENTWLVWTFFSLILLPTLATCCTIPDLAAVYRAAGFTPVIYVMVFGAIWGLSQVLFGIAVDTIGIALTFSLVLGTSASVGALIPLMRLHPDKLHTPSGHILLLGIATMLLGVAICAVAGSMRDHARSAGALEQRKSAALGSILAILCGCGAASMNFGLAYGASLTSIAILHGASSANSSNAIWLPLLAAGAIPNLLYCIFLLNRNSSSRNFRASWLNHGTLALVMAIFWFGSVLLYGASVAMLGPLGAAVGWPLFMSLIVIAASLLGIATGEWKGSGRRPLAIQLGSVAVLILAVFILASATQAMT